MWIQLDKARGGDEIPAGLFQILKDDAVKVLHSICQKIWKTKQRLQDWKKSVFIPIPKEDNAKKCSNYCTLVLISHAIKNMLKILQARLQLYMKRGLSDVQAGFRKCRETRVQITNIYWVIKKSQGMRPPRRKKHLLLLHWQPKAIDCVDHNKLREILKEMRIPDHLIWFLRNLMQIKKQQLELHMEQWFGSKLGKEYIKAVYCHLLI